MFYLFGKRRFVVFSFFEFVLGAIKPTVFEQFCFTVATGRRQILHFNGRGIVVGNAFLCHLFLGVSAGGKDGKITAKSFVLKQLSHASLWHFKRRRFVVVDFQFKLRKIVFAFGKCTVAGTESTGQISIGKHFESTYL